MESLSIQHFSFILLFAATSRFAMRTNKDYPCIVCCIRPIFIVGRFLGFAPLSTECASQGKPCSFSPSLLWILVSLGVAGLISGTMIATLYDWENLNLGVPIEHAVIVQVINTIESLNYLMAVVLVVLNTLQSKTTANALNSIAIFLQNPGEHSQRSITEEEERAIFSVAIRQTIYLTVVLLLQNLVVIYFYVIHWATIPSHGFIILKGIMGSISNAVFLINGFQFGVVTRLLRLMIFNVKSQLQVLIEKAQSRSDSLRGTDRPNQRDLLPCEQRTSTGEGVPKICDSIAKVRRLYGSVVQCQHKFNQSVNPQLAIVTALIMVSIVLSSYLIFQYAMTGNKEILFLLSNGRLFTNIFTALYMIHLSDRLFKMVGGNLWLIDFD